MFLKECFVTPITTSRNALFLHLTTSDAKKTVAEICPLSSYSIETVDDVLNQFNQIQKTLLTTRWNKISLACLETLSLFPSLYFALESALLDLLEPLSGGTCYTYALLMGSREEILQRAKEARAEGFLHAKIKLAPFSLEEAHQLIASLKNDFHLRIDLNRKWDLEKTTKFCAFYPLDFFEYIEEPATHWQDLKTFSYPFALDESLREEKSSLSLLSSPYLKALILKPTLIYPLLPFLKLGPKIVLSSSFEGFLGITQLTKLALRLKLQTTYHGFDTLRYQAAI